MSDEADRDRADVVRLRKADHRRFAWICGSLLVAAAVGAAVGDESWLLWPIMCGLLFWLFGVARRDSRRRDAAVLAMDDAAVREYLRGRLDGLIWRHGHIVHGVLGAVVLLIGAALLAAQLAYDAKPGKEDHLSFAVAFVALGGAMAVTAFWSRFVYRPKLASRRAELGAAPAAPAPWIVETTRGIAATRGPAHAALFWHEAVGVPMPAARAAVRRLPEPAAAAEAAEAPGGPPVEWVRGRMRGVVRRELLGRAGALTLLLALAAAEVWEQSAVAPDERRFVARNVFLALAALHVLSFFAYWSAERRALAADDASLRLRYAHDLGTRIKRVSRWSPFEIVLAVVGVVFLATALVSVGVNASRGTIDRAWPWLVESLLFVLWLDVLPWRARKRLRPILERERDEFVAAGGKLPEPPPLP